MSIKSLIGWRTALVCAAIPLLGIASIGCSATPIGFAMHVAGDAVNDVDEMQKAQQYVGAPVAEADAKLGAPIDVLSDVNSSRTWRVYAVPMDPLNTSRYVIEVHRGKIIALCKTQPYSDPVEYAAALAVLEPKVMAQSMAKCEANLGMGAPLLTVRSQATGCLIQIYDARMVKELQGPHYCVLRFNQVGVCEKITMVKAYTTGGDPTQQ